MAIPRLPSAASLFLALLLILLLPAAAVADGKIFARATAAPTPIPDQQAIIVYDAKSQTQTLAIETRFIPPPPAAPAANSTQPSDAAPFAWVVPLPGPDAPTIRAATTGLFPTVREVFQPRVEHGGGDIAFLMVLGIVLTLLGLLITLVQKHNILVSILFGVVLMSVVGVLLPALGSARSSVRRSDSLVNVLDRTTVGSYDITVIGASAPTANADPLAAGKDLAAWLKDNGFQMPAGVEPVLEHYAARKWVFAACKLREVATPSASGPLAPHPLIFTFKTPQCVYPLELTSVGNGPLSVDLYVFANQQAAAPHFDLVRSQIMTADDAHPGPHARVWPRGRVTLGHPLLHELAQGMLVATKLTATLTPQQQSTDAVLTWTEASESGGVKFSKKGASGAALDAASGALLITLIILIVLAAMRKQGAPWVFRKCTWALLIAFIVGGAVYVALPKVEVKEGGFRTAHRMHNAHHEIASEAMDELGRLDPANAQTDLPRIDQARAAVQRLWKEQVEEDRAPLPREEDSPMNYIIREGKGSGTIEYVWYDAVGTPQVEPIWP